MMPDGNTAALRAYEAERDRNDRRHYLYGSSAVASIVDALFRGRKVAGRTLHDFCTSISSEEIGALLLTSGDDRTAKLASIENQVKEEILAWCEGNGADEVAEREHEAEEDAKAGDY